MHLFYSWQSDRDSKLCRNFIEGALEAAKERIETERGVVLAIDRDTKGVAGTPPITPTILRKIDACDIFVADMTFVGRAENDVAGTGAGKLMPNPNVMFEYGYARHVLDDEQILLAFNAAFGSFKELPFDLALMRRPTEYSAAPGIADGARRNARDAYADLLVDHLGQIIDFVLGKRLLATMDDETLLDQARGRLALLDSSRQAGEAPAIVSSPCLKLALVPLTIPRDHIFDNALMKSLRPNFVPVDFANNRRIDTATSRQWASHDPLRPIPEKPNDEARWSTRVLRPGAFETLQTIAYFEGDDTITGLELHKLEAKIVDGATRLARLAVVTGFSGPALLVTSLHELEAVEPYAGHRSGSFGRRRDVSLGELKVAALEDLDALALKTMLDGLWMDAGFDDGSPSFSSGAWDGARGDGPYRLD
ncbi:hypothetical protein [Sphingomonas sp. UYAg733]